MKKLFFVLLIFTAVLTARSQSLCQAMFTYDFNTPMMQGMNLYDQSFNHDSTDINIVTWNWTFTGGGMQLTSNLQNPINIPYFIGMHVCLTIHTLEGCTSTYCTDISNSECNLNIIGQVTPNSNNCNGEIQVTAENGIPPYTYLWSNSISTPTISDLCTGIYVITVTDANGCAAIDSFYVSGNDSTNCEIFINYYEINGAYFFLDSIHETNPMATYMWTFEYGALTTSSNGPIAQMYFNYSGIVHVCLHITNPDGTICTECADIEVNGSPNLCDFTVDAQITHVSTIGGNDGAINLTVTGGTPPYSFLWNNGSTEEDQTGLSSGAYFVRITDAVCQEGLFNTFYLYEPNDSNTVIIDTLYSPIVDTCLTFVPTSFYITNVSVLSNYIVSVTWTFTDGTQTQSITVEYTYSVDGAYMVILTIDCNGKKELSSYMSYIYANFYSATSLPVFDKTESNIFPNPASEEVNITAQPPYSVQLFDLNGKLLQEAKVSEIHKKIQISDYNNGIYFIHISSEKGSSVKKLMINR